MAEWGNWVADGISGRARKMADVRDGGERVGGVGGQSMECGGRSARSSSYKDGAPTAGVETSEQHAVGVVLGRIGGNRTDCKVGTRNITEHILY
jgi:hypothetical protein